MDYFHLSAGQDTINKISALGLAHLGDGVYELMVRSWLCLHGKARPRHPAPAHRGGAGRLPPGPQQPHRRRPPRSQRRRIPRRHGPGIPVRLAVPARPYRPSQRAV